MAIPTEILRENERRNKSHNNSYDPISGKGCCGSRIKVVRPGGGRDYDPAIQYVPASMAISDAPRKRAKRKKPKSPSASSKPAKLKRITSRDDGKVATKAAAKPRKRKRTVSEALLKLSSEEWAKLRCRHDFEYWAATCGTIRDKESGRIIPFRLNRPQRRVLRIIEERRRAGKPIRLILLKARQWGGSTLVMYYMAWIQTCLAINWNSLICAQVKDTASTIRGMYSRLIERYPAELWQPDAEAAGAGIKGASEPKLIPFEGSRNTRLIPARGCTITVGSSESQDAIRGGDYAMAHLSEVAFWRDSEQSSPEQFIRAICGSVLQRPLTLIVLESTANGAGNFFHREWLRADRGNSDKTPVFVPWHEIDMYRAELADEESASRLWDEMDDYERRLWHDHGCTLEAIAWFHAKRREYPSLELMLAEYPTTSEEAFTYTDRAVFPVEQCERLRSGCIDPVFKGEIVGATSIGTESLSDIRLVAGEGNMSIWRMPEVTGKPLIDCNRYVAAVDIGGRSEGSNWSVISVIDTSGGIDGETPEVVAQWRGHDYHDRLAWTAARIARFYSDALLVFESNSLEHSTDADDPSLYILSQVQRHYRRLYMRRDPGGGMHAGFHTNRATKSLIINHLIALVRDNGYIERCDLAVNELLSYEATPSGGFEARRGCNDDILMSRAIALHVVNITRRTRAAAAYF